MIQPKRVEEKLFLPNNLHLTINPHIFLNLLFSDWADHKHLIWRVIYSVTAISVAHFNSRKSGGGTQKCHMRTQGLLLEKVSRGNVITYSGSPGRTEQRAKNCCFSKQTLTLYKSVWRNRALGRRAQASSQGGEAWPSCRNVVQRVVGELAAITNDRAEQQQAEHRWSGTSQIGLPLIGQHS